MLNKTLKLFTVFSFFTLFFFLQPVDLSAASGKITGKIIDAETGEPLGGVNVIIEGKVLGAATDIDGNYFILNVPPGIHTIKASFIGYVSVKKTNIHVAIGLTTIVDFELKVQTVELSEIVVKAEKPIVRADVSANIANMGAKEIETLPVVSVKNAIALQAGVESELRIRGGTNDQLAFVVDGDYMRDSRNNRAFSTVSLTSLSELQIQTGGFNAEYGNLRSGLINITTKEPKKSKYSVDILVRYEAPHSYSFDNRNLKSDDAYWWRPYTDSLVAFYGTKGKNPDTRKILWDDYTRRQYPIFEGWNKATKSYNRGKAPEDQLTPEELQEVFLYHSRKDVEITDPTYTIDMTVGGPLIPSEKINSKLGNARFLISYVRNQTPYFYPQARKVAMENYFRGKIISNTSSSTKLELTGMWNKQEGMAYSAVSTVVDPNPQIAGIPKIPWEVHSTPTMLYDNVGHVGRSMFYGTDRYAVTDVNRMAFGGNFTKVLNARSFYKTRLNYMKVKYNSDPDRRRNPAIVYKIGNLALDEAPFGWTSNGLTSPGSQLRIGGHWARARDTSNTAAWTGQFDYTNQLTDWMEIKTGLFLQRNEYNMRFASDDSIQVELDRSKQHWSRNTNEAALYLQGKFEFEGMIANAGLRLDYFSPSGDWYVYDTYDRAFTASNASSRDEMLSRKPIESQLSLSPRIGISFPITKSSKLYFNYGHFIQKPSPMQMFQIDEYWLGNIGGIGNPDIPFMKTVAYELGYDQNLFDQFLLRLSGYYRDNSDEPSQINYINIDGLVNYYLEQPYAYSDVRGFEITLNKLRGDWIRGFATYSYMQYSSGTFGYSRQFENVVQQKNYENGSTDYYQFRPTVEPYATINLDFFTPSSLESDDIPTSLYKDWHFNFIGLWRAGQTFTWIGPGGIQPQIQYNISMRDYWNLDLRISKDIKTSFGKLLFFVDISNIINIKYMFFNPSFGGIFEGARDYEDYMTSLHLSDDVFKGFTPNYTNISGSDKPGDYRDYGTEFVPIEAFNDEAGFPNRAPRIEEGRYVLYYSKSTNQYYEFNEDGVLVDANKQFVNKVLENKSYIDMPNLRHRTFLNPISVKFGIRISF